MSVQEGRDLVPVRSQTGAPERCSGLLFPEYRTLWSKLLIHTGNALLQLRVMNHYTRIFQP